MNFELKTCDLAGAAAFKSDAVLLLVTDAFKPAKDALSQIVAQAIAAGDLETKTGKLLQLYKPADIAAPRVVLVGAGDGSARQLRAAGYRVGAAVVDGGEPHHRADLGEPVALVLGSEAHGLPAEVVAAADLAITIDMAGPTESLNVAMAGTLLCFEVLRRRH